MNALRDFLLGCGVCGKPPLWRSLGHGRQRHLDFCGRRKR
jgi:hypothetical protein